MSWETTDVLSADTTDVLSADTTDVLSADTFPSEIPHPGFARFDISKMEFVYSLQILGDFPVLFVGVVLSV